MFIEVLMLLGIFLFIANLVALVVIIRRPKPPTWVDEIQKHSVYLELLNVPQYIIKHSLAKHRTLEELKTKNDQLREAVKKYIRK